MDLLMVTQGLSQGFTPITTTVVKLSLIYFLLHVPFMVFHHIFAETMVLKIYLWLLGWKKILVVNSKVHIFWDGKKTSGCISKHCHSKLYHRSVHNIRIERLWVDVTAQVGATWAEHFQMLEVRHGLDINNIIQIGRAHV